MSHDAVLMATFLNGLVSIDIPNLVLKEEFARIFHQRQKGCNKNFLVISNGLALPVVQLQWLAQPNSNPAYQKCLVIGVLSLSVPGSCRRSKLARRSCLLLRFLLEQVDIEWIFAWQSYLVQSTGHILEESISFGPAGLTAVDTCCSQHSGRTQMCKEHSHCEKISVDSLWVAFSESTKHCIDMLNELFIQAFAFIHQCLV